MKRLLVVVGLVPSCGGGGGFPVDAEPPPPPPKGKFSMTWAVDDLGGTPIPCAQVGGNFVNVNLRNSAVLGGEVESFSCSSLMATSLLSFVPGNYDLSFALNGTVGELATAPTQTGIEIKSNETTVVPPVTFMVDATGKLDLALATGIAGGNCGGGAGVNNVTISLTHTGGAICEPVSFAISAGASQPAGTYTIDCAAAFNGCINNDQRLTVTTVPSGSYRVQINEKVNNNDCYLTTQTLVVPPLGKTLMQTLNLTHQTTGC